MKIDKKTFISVFITDDKEMKKLNKEYLNRDYTTDVLSFEINEKQEDGSLYLGDIVVNKDQAKRQAKTYENDFEEEISELVGHGVLHLLGIHHKGDGIPVDTKSKVALKKLDKKFVKKDKVAFKVSSRKK
ncbi:rRNA maturation RNase YbeY [Patescibacteria group bacterium]|jgi:probable rRNA maturation factor|nr:rRNA maturation RNase YbeY [Patescibacteria group bacterium]